jgi:hypothetical protein
VGECGAGDRALGLLAVRLSAPLAVLAAGLLGGCKSIPVLAGIAAGAAAGGASSNPAVGFAVGVAVSAGGSYVVDWVGRTRQHAEQQAIADVAAPMKVGRKAPWRIRHTIPIGDEHGHVWVVREFATPLAICKEVVFSVVEGDSPTSKRSWYDTTICRDPSGWEWAAAEPAVPRWGFLQ